MGASKALPSEIVQKQESNCLFEEIFLQPIGIFRWKSIFQIENTAVFVRNFVTQTTPIKSDKKIVSPKKQKPHC